MKRRTFLKNAMSTSLLAGLGGASSSVLLRAFPDPSIAWLGSPVNPHERILVVIRLFGGNDGLNTIVPVHDDAYYRLRRDKAQYNLSIAAEAALPIAGHNAIRFHPAMAPLATLYNEGKVAIVQGVGYPNMDLSHFGSTRVWLSASDIDSFEKGGWMGRYLEQRQRAGTLDENAPYAIELGPHVGIAFEGREKHMGFTFNGSAFTSDAPIPTDMLHSTADLERLLLENRLRGESHLKTILSTVNNNLSSGEGYYTQGGNMMPDLQTVARCIRSRLSTPMYIVHTGMFDTHHFQPVVHAQQLDEVCTNILAFYRELESDGLDDRVTILVMSEFGRRPETNTSGTDHGTAGPVFLIGTHVKGGMHGVTPSVEDLNADGNLHWHVDFRCIYASILEQWFGSTPDDYLPAVLHQRFNTMQLFQQSHVNNGIPIVTRPNPAWADVNIDLGTPFTGPARVTVTDVLGSARFVTDVHFFFGSASIDVRSLSQGTYYGLVTGQSGVSHFSFVVAR